MDEDSLNQFLSINQILRKKVYIIQMPEAIILDLDSTILNYKTLNEENKGYTDEY